MNCEVCELYLSEVVRKEVNYLYLVTNKFFFISLKCLWSIHIHCWWECKLAQPLWKGTLAISYLHLTQRFHFWKSTLKICFEQYKRHVDKSIHCSIIYKSWNSDNEMHMYKRTRKPRYIDMEWFLDYMVKCHKQSTNEHLYYITLYKKRQDRNYTYLQMKYKGKDNPETADTVNRNRVENEEQ